VDYWRLHKTQLHWRTALFKQLVTRECGGQSSPAG